MRSLLRLTKKKRENLNLWLFSEQNPKAVKLTDADFIYSFAQSPDHRTVVYTSRYGSSDSDEGCLELFDHCGQWNDINTKTIL